MNFDFQNPALLFLLLILPILAILRSSTGRTASVIFSNIAIAKLASMNTRSSSRSILFFLRLLCLALLIVGLARPRLGSGYVQREESGIDIVLSIDVSGSMRALDFTKDNRYPITRLDAVKSVVTDFIKKRPNDRIGVVIFGVNAFLMSPITLDHDWLLQNLERVELGVIDGGATAIGSSIVRSAEMLNSLTDSKSKVLILLTDGDNNAGSVSPIAAAEAAGALDIKIHTISAGKDGIVPLAALDRNGRLSRDKYGRPIVADRGQSSADDKALKEISQITKGKFFRAENLKQLNDIYSEIDKLEKTKVQLEHFTSYEELYQYFLILALCFLGLEVLLANTIYRRIP
ncbi:MAG: VWA domain-containing protein [Opitutales bacterium]